MTVRYRRRFQFELIWEAPRPLDRRLVTFADVVSFDDRDTAVRAHTSACEGRWVTGTESRATVGPLIEYLTPVDESGVKPTMSRETVGGPIRPGKDLWKPQGPRVPYEAVTS